MSTKHEKILEYIQDLDIGNKISVRQIAKALDVSDGTAYRAIKNAELRGLVKTVERVGTVRIEQRDRSDIEKLTFAEVVNIVDGQVLGGFDGLHKTLNRFVIGAMKLEDMMRYVDPGSLLIVGNRDNVHLISLEREAAVLITGGFDTTQAVKDLADQMELPVISSAYDTFTVASLINRAIYDRLIKKEILLMEDVIAADQVPYSIFFNETVARFHELVQETGLSRYPVIDNADKVVGMITTKDVINVSVDERIDTIMISNPMVVTAKTSLAAVAHEMVWEGIELVPVVDEQRRLVGVVSRQDVIKSLQYMQKQPQVGETIQTLSFRGFEETVGHTGQPIFRGEITPQMTNALGILSTGVLTSLITETSLRLLRRIRRDELAVQNVTLYHLKPIQLESVVEIVPKILDSGRKLAKLDVEVFYGQQLVAKALLTANMLNNPSN